MEKSHESFMINDNFGDHVIYFLMGFAGVFESTFYWQSNLDWSISDAILSTITFGIGAFLIRLMLNYYPVGKSSKKVIPYFWSERFACLSEK